MTALEQDLRDFPHRVLTDVEIEMLIGGTPDSRYGKVKRLIANGKLLHIRRGLYCLTKPHPFEVAQYIYTSSYISLESALQYHGLIPETVYTITSASGGRSKQFNTPLGIFDYQHLPFENLYTDVELIQENDFRFLMAKPWKAICDYVYCYKKDWNNLEPLSKSLRINPDDLPELSDQLIDELNEYYHQKRLHRFLKGISKDLKKRELKK